MLHARMKDYGAVDGINGDEHLLPACVINLTCARWAISGAARKGLAATVNGGVMSSLGIKSQQSAPSSQPQRDNYAMFGHEICYRHRRRISLIVGRGLTYGGACEQAGEIVRGSHSKPCRFHVTSAAEILRVSRK